MFTTPGVIRKKEITAAIKTVSQGCGALKHSSPECLSPKTLPKIIIPEIIHFKDSTAINIFLGGGGGVYGDCSFMKMSKTTIKG